MLGVKRRNRSAVLQALLRHGPLARTDIRRLTMLAPSTVTNLTAELIDRGLIHEIGPGHDGAVERVGRPSVLLDLKPRGGYVIGAHLGARRLSLSLGDLRATVLDSLHLPLSPGMTVENLLAALLTGVEKLLERAGIEAHQVFGCGLAAAGRVDSERGVLVQLPYHAWTNLPLAYLLGRRSGLPWIVDDSRRAMALAEISFGASRDIASLILIHIGTTIGCGLVIDGRIVAGDHFDAGKLGHVVVESDGARCVCGNRGCLETIASDEGIVRLARAALAQASSGRAVPSRLLTREPLTRGAVVRAAQQGDTVATGVIMRAATALGRSIANLALILDPSVVVVAGGVSEAGDLLLAPVRETVDAIVGRALGRSVAIRPSALGQHEPLVAALTIALQRVVYSPDLVLPGEAASISASGAG